MKFEDQVKQKLGVLNQKQLIQFAWLWGLRALPFLSVERDFAYWRKGDRQKYLYSVFNALDVSALATLDYTAAAKAAATCFYTAVETADNSFYIGTTYAAQAAYAAHAAVDYAAKAKKAREAAAIAAYPDATDSNYILKLDADRTAAKAAEAADAVAYTAAKVTYAAEDAARDNYIENFDWERILFNDIEAIKENKLVESNHDANIYGELWGHFIDDLKSIGCEYWAELYQDLFDNGFKLNEEELKLRLSVLDEIKAEGAKAVAEQINILKKQKTADVQRARIILIGSAAAGKTTLARKLKNENASLAGYDSTHGVDRNIEIDFNGVITQIWDFGGQVIYHSSHRCFMSERCVYILVVNARKNDDYHDIGKIKYWLDTVQDYAKGKAKVFIVINEEDDRKYNYEDISKSLVKEYKDLVNEKFFAFNIGKDKESLLGFKSILSEYIESKGRQKIAANEKKALDEIKTLFEKGTKLLKKGGVFKILERCGIEDKERALDLFDTLGAALYYEDFDDFVIDPYWVSHGIYKVIDYMQNPKIKQPIYEYKLKEIFVDDYNYYEKGAEYVFELMARYKIGFRNSELKGLFVPCVAAFYKPVGTTEPDFDNYIVKFERDKLKEFPAGFFDRFMADNAKDMNNRNDALEFWQTGMVLIKNETNALIEMIENRKIVITVWGEQKEQYADELIRSVDTLLKELDSVAIGRDENDLMGNPKKAFIIYRKDDPLIKKIIETLTAATLIEQQIEKIMPYVIKGFGELQNIYMQLIK